MISNSNPYSSLPWKYNLRTEKKDPVDQNNFKETEYYDGNFDDNRNLVNCDDSYYEINSDSNDDEINRSLKQSINHKSVEETDSTDIDSVVFERIVPKEVKKLWVRAVESPDYPINKEHNNHQNMIQSAHHGKHDKRISQEYGDVFLSHDIVREEKRKNDLKLTRNSSVSESPELPVARSKWGINLRHVVKKEKLDGQGSETLPFGFPRLRRLSSTENSRPLSMGEEQIHGIEGHSVVRRSKSTDFLNDGITDKCRVDVDKLNELPDSNKKMSVNERRQNFESRSSTLPSRMHGFDKYRSHSPAKRENSFVGAQTSFFYQGPPLVRQYSNDNSRIDHSQVKSPVEKKAPVSLEDLLKQDEIRLTVDVLDQPKNNRIEDESNAKTRNGSFNEADLNHNAGKFDGHVPTSDNKGPRSPRLENNIGPTSSPLQNRIWSTNDSSSAKVNHTDPIEKDNLVYNNRQTKDRHLLEGRTEHSIQTKFETPPSDHINRSPLHKSKPVRKIFASAAPVSESYNSTVQPKTSDGVNAIALSTSKLHAESDNTPIHAKSNIKHPVPVIRKEVTNNILPDKHNERELSIIPTKSVEPVMTPVNTNHVEPATSQSANQVQPAVTHRKAKNMEPVLSHKTSKHDESVGISLSDLHTEVQDIPIPSKRKENEEPTVISPPKIRYNKLGQVILDDVDKITAKPIEPSPVKMSVQKSNVISANNNASQMEKKIYVPEIKPVKDDVIVSSKLKKGSTKESNQNSSFGVSVSSSGTDLTVSKNKIRQTNVNSDNNNNTMTMNNIPNGSPKRDAPKPPPQQSMLTGNTQPSLSQQKRRVGKLIIMTGDQRDEQLRNKSKNKTNSTPAQSAGSVRQITLKKEIVAKSPNNQNSNPMNGMALTFMSNELDELDEDPNAPAPVVPKIIFNSPIVDVKSIMTSSGVNRNKNRKKGRVSFSNIKLATVYTYPSESSYYEEDKSITSVSLTGLSSYQPSTVNDLGSVVQRERERIHYSGGKMSDTPYQQQIQYSSEGDHFNMHHTQEGGHALLF